MTMNINEVNEKFQELCFIGDLEQVKKHVSEHSPDLDSQYPINGWTALHWAAKQNHSNIVKFLLDKGASKDKKNNEGKVPAEISTDSTIRTILGSNLISSKNEAATSNEDEYEFIPNFKRYPEFHYADKSLYSQSETSGSATNEAQSSSQTISNRNQEASRMITIRISTDIEDDLIEINVDPSRTTFKAFKQLCMRELESDYLDVEEYTMSDFRLNKILKLPDVRIRNSKDVKRLKNGQCVKFFFDHKDECPPLSDADSGGGDQEEFRGDASKMVTIKIGTNREADFVELELDPSNTSFDAFKEICVREFDYVKKDLRSVEYRLTKVRTEPNRKVYPEYVRIRNSDDVKKLKTGQCVQFFYRRKNE